MHYDKMSSVTGQTFSGYPETQLNQLNKQQFTTAKVSLGQVGRLVGRHPTWGELVGRDDVGAK